MVTNVVSQIRRKIGDKYIRTVIGMDINLKYENGRQRASENSGKSPLSMVCLQYGRRGKYGFEGFRGGKAYEYW